MCGVWCCACFRKKDIRGRMCWREGGRAWFFAWTAGDGKVGVVVVVVMMVHRLDHVGRRSDEERINTPLFSLRLPFFTLLPGSEPGE